MADNSIALQIKPVDTMTPLAHLLDIGNAAVELKRRQATLPSDIARAQAESSSAQTGARVAAETADPRIEQQKQLTQQSQIETLKAKFGLDKDQAQLMRQLSTGLVQDPDVIAGNGDAMIGKIAQVRQQMIEAGVPAAKAEFHTSNLVQLASHAPGQVRQFLANAIRSSMAADSQAGQSLVPASQQQQPGAAMGPTAAPTTQMRDQFGNLSVQPMNVQSSNGQPGAPGDAPTEPPKLLTYPQGESPQTAAPLHALRDQAQAAAAQAPAQHFNNRQILDLAPQAFTGTGGGMLAKIMNSFGLQSTNDAGADTSQLRHFLGLQIQENAKAQGANTDAARALAEQAVLPSDSPEKAIKAITKVNDAYVTGNELFNKGLQASIASPNNKKDIFAARDFQNAWSQTFDPRIMQLENAAAAKDTAEIDRIKKQLGPEGIKQLLRKAVILRRLSQGTLPNAP